jgi:hypothetical protein
MMVTVKYQKTLTFVYKVCFCVSYVSIDKQQLCNQTASSSGPYYEDAGVYYEEQIELLYVGLNLYSLLPILFFKDSSCLLQLWFSHHFNNHSQQLFWYSILIT